MELFIWLWAFDKRLFFQYSGRSFVYIWLIPIVLSATVLGLTCFLRVTSSPKELQTCMATSHAVEHTAVHVQKLMMVQEAVLISIFFAALLSLIVADKMVKKSEQALQNQQPVVVCKKDGTVRRVIKPVRGQASAYDFKMRNDTIRSLPSLCLLILACANYLFSYYFKSGIDSYDSAVSAAVKLAPALNCEIAGFSVLANYSFLFVLVPGSLTLLAYTCALLQKVFAALSVIICPVAVTKCRKRSRGMPLNFENYENEFEFELDDDEVPKTYPEDVEVCNNSSETEGDVDERSPMKIKKASVDIEMGLYNDPSQTSLSAISP